MVFFERTNETLEAITDALSIKPDDKVISICGCGAQPLALLEYITGNGSVLTVDYNPEQIRFAKKVIRLMKEFEQSNSPELEKLKLTPNDEHYFCDRRRLRKIIRNLDRLNFRQMDVSIEQRIKGKFSKGYFSNATVNFRYFHTIFETGALVYVAFGAAELIPDQIDKFLEARSRFYGYQIQDFYDVEKARTVYACKIEASKLFRWTPVVFRRK